MEWFYLLMVEHADTFHFLYLKTPSQLVDLYESQLLQMQNCTKQSLVRIFLHPDILFVQMVENPSIRMEMSTLEQVLF